MELKVNKAFSSILPLLSKEEDEALALSIKTEGILIPIIIDENNVILDGHHRYKHRGKHEFSVTTLGGMSVNQKKAFILQSGLTRRNMSAIQKAETLEKAKVIVIELRGEKDDEGHVRYSQAHLGMMFGIPQRTISRWLTKVSGISHVAKAGQSKPDAREKVSVPTRRKVLKKLKKGASVRKVAKEEGVPKSTVADIAKEKMKSVSPVKRNYVWIRCPTCSGKGKLKKGIQEQ